MAPKDIDSLDALLRDQPFVGGFTFGAADAEHFASMTSAPSRAAAPHAFRWYKHCAAQLGVKSASLASQGGAAPSFPVPTPPADAVGMDKPSFAAGVVDGGDRGVPEGCLPAAPAPAAADDMGGDDLFGDDDMGGDDLFGDDDAEAAPAMSLAEKAKAAKAAKEAKKKKDKVEKSQVVIEVKPWEADQDLPSLYEKIKREVTMDGLQWGEAYKLQEVGYGIKKLVMSCVIEDEKVMTDDFLEPIQEMEDDVQSVEMCTMNRL